MDVHECGCKTDGEFIYHTKACMERQRLRRDARLEMYRTREAENVNDQVPIEWHGPVKWLAGWAAMGGAGTVALFPVANDLLWPAYLFFWPLALGTWLGGVLICGQGKWEMAYHRRLSEKPGADREMADWKP
jgi:hypothetical protein